MELSSRNHAESFVTRLLVDRVVEYDLNHCQSSAMERSLEEQGTELCNIGQ